MTFPNELLQAFNQQIAHERLNQAKYAQLASILDSRNLFYLAQYLEKQADGEASHAKRLIKYMADRDCLAILQAVEAPNIDLGISAQQCFAIALEIELGTTRAAKELFMLARAMDPQAEIELQWLMVEQVEEEKNVGEIVDRFARSAALGDEWMDDWMHSNFERLVSKA
jgi:ferritin